MCSDVDEPLRPAAVCRALLAALDAAEGRRHSRKRDQTPDGIGLSIKRDLLQRAIDDDPAADDFEAWLMTYCEAHGGGSEDPPLHRGEREGSRLAMARAVFDEWRLARSLGTFRRWLEDGAPSEDKRPRSD